MAKKLWFGELYLDKDKLFWGVIRKRQLKKFAAFLKDIELPKLRKFFIQTSRYKGDCLKLLEK